MLKFIEAGTYNFTCAKAIEKEKANSEVAIHFRNDGGNGDCNLTLLYNNTTELWSNSCNESECEIIGLVSVSKDLACDGLSLQIETEGNASLAIPVFLNVTLNDVIAVLKDTSSDGQSLRVVNTIDPGNYDFVCSDIVAEIKNFDNPPERIELQIEFVNDAVGHPTILTLLNGTTEVWNGNCFGKACVINQTVVDGGLICDHMSILIEHYDDYDFEETAEVRVSFEAVEVVYEVDAFSPGVFNFTCGNAVTGS